MTLPARLDRLWLWLLGLACCVMIPLWLIMWGQEMGWLNLGFVILGLFLFGLWRGVSKAT